MQRMGKKSILLEIVIPFCFHKCSCCSQNVIIGADTKLKESYIQALCKETEANAAEFSDCTIAAIRFSGGITSTVPAQSLEKLIKIIDKEYNAADAEISMRAIPGSISADDLVYYRRARMTRYELEALSMDYSDGVTLGCLDIRDVLPITIKMLNMSKCKAIGSVIAYGVKGQTQKDWRRSLIGFIRTELKHFRLMRCVNELAAGEEITKQQLQQARQLFSQYNYREYIPNHFSLAGYEDRFAIMESQGAEILSFGLNARTRLDGAETRNTSDMAVYLSHSDDFRLITVSAHPLLDPK